MIVRELIQLLQAMPQDDEVYAYVGESSGPVIGAGVADGHVALIDEVSLDILTAPATSGVVN